MGRFAVAEGKLRRPTVAEGRIEFIFMGSRQRRTWKSLFIFSRSLSMPRRSSEEYYGII